MPAEELPAPGRKGFAFCALTVLALLVAKEKLSSPAYPPKAAYLRKNCGRFCVQMLLKKERPRGWKNCVSVPNSHREKFQRGCSCNSGGICLTLHTQRGPID